MLNEFSPRIREDYLLDIFPFLGHYYGKGCFYLIIGSFCFDKTLNDFAEISGVSLLVCGASWIVFEFILSKYADDNLQFKYPTTNFGSIKEVRHSKHVFSTNAPTVGELNVGTYKPPPIE